MLQSNDDARKAMFSGFNGFQDKFFEMLVAYSKATTSQDRSSIATRFVKDVVIPYLDASKDALLKEYAQPLQAIEAELVKLLQVFGEGSA